jgi:DNA-binding MarR family transcriptional regulator
MSSPEAERSAARKALAARLYRARVDRSLYFQPAIFGDSGWDTLLAIYVFGAAGRTLSAGELCRAMTATSATSALRVQRRFVDLKLIRRVPHPTDQRRILIELTPEGRAMLEDYLDHVLENHLTSLRPDEPDALIAAE